MFHDVCGLIRLAPTAIEQGLSRRDASRLRRFVVGHNAAQHAHGHFGVLTR